MDFAGKYRMDMDKKSTLILGASNNPARYSNMAINRLRALGHPVKAIGRRPGVVADVTLETEQSKLSDIDTVSVYLNPANQKEYYTYLLHLHPRRIIFNPGAENSEFEELARKHGIETLQACTLVMLSTGQY